MPLPHITQLLDYFTIIGAVKLAFITTFVCKSGEISLKCNYFYTLPNISRIIFIKKMKVRWGTLLSFTPKKLWENWIDRPRPRRPIPMKKRIERMLGQSTCSFKMCISYQLFQFVQTKSQIFHNLLPFAGILSVEGSQKARKSNAGVPKSMIARP